MKINNASSTALTAQQALLAAKQSTASAFEKNSQEFGPIAASVIGLANRNPTWKFPGLVSML